MNMQNIVSAGKMMAIVAVLLGAVFCGATLAPYLSCGHGFFDAFKALGTPDPSYPVMFGVVPLYSVLFGVALTVCGVVLLATFGRAAGRPALGTLVLVFGTLTALLGVVAVALVYRSPFSWMTAIVGLAIFIDALCLKIAQSQKRAFSKF